MHVPSASAYCRGRSNGPRAATAARRCQRLQPLESVVGGYSVARRQRQRRWGEGSVVERVYRAGAATVGTAAAAANWQQRVEEDDDGASRTAAADAAA